MFSRGLLSCVLLVHVLLVQQFGYQFKMAGADSHVVTFDLIDDIVLDKSTNLLDTLTEEEHEEVENVVTLLDCAKEDSLQHFELTMKVTALDAIKISIPKN